ncbi:hypothetical protein [Streptomyces sp. NPDC058401]|uniref:hypothetical protein n=1 Tax=Streptomyces sp. NPDC058401 TaxID=3346480 RepID=UPI003651693F
MAALGDLLPTPSMPPALVRTRLQAAAEAVEQAGRAPGERSLAGQARAEQRSSARVLERAPRTVRGGGAAVVVPLLLVLVEAVEPARLWHEAKERQAQAKAAAAAGLLPCEAAKWRARRLPVRPYGSFAYTGLGPWPGTVRMR